MKNLVPIEKWILDYGKRNRPSTFEQSGIYGFKREPDEICVHNTGNQSPTANARNHAAWLANTADLVVGYHYTIDDEEIWQHIPINEAAWHAGDGLNGHGNRYSIGLEICENKLGANDYSAYLEAEENGAWLCAKLIKTVPSLKPFPDCVKQHYDYSGKDCPQVIRNRSNGWQEFLDKVKYFLDHWEEPEEDNIVWQVATGSYGDLNNAKAALYRLLHAGFSPKAYGIEHNGQELYRVVAAEKKTRQQAIDTVDLVERYADMSAWVVKYDLNKGEPLDLEPRPLPPADEPEDPKPDPEPDPDPDNGNGDQGDNNGSEDGEKTEFLQWLVKQLKALIAAIIKRLNG